ncbi:DUF2085 domain-containing protein [Methanobacterium congolense]|jgi:uncharacterized membrane protein|uniref:DUF2085 domain-containing protein n=1 Tax=Methanobacterium congolense TaxID=118062 RepID=A0A1D3L1K5_9EURY|nr:DUF2085 domain-containing protein [Methanobacterium congolense]SCG85435.1 putative protein MTH_518 [Methanobacterium congolense]
MRSQNSKDLDILSNNKIKDIQGSFICHRLPERTFKVKGHYFPVCSRCTGAYIGAFSYFIFVYFFYVQYDITIILTAILMILPMFLDGITQLFSFRVSNNALRFTTGLIAGIGLGILAKVFKYFLIGLIN